MLFGTLFVPKTFSSALEAFIVFCALSSGVYFMNDIKDAAKDRFHPIKRNRPIASGKLSVRTAWFISAALILGSVWYSYTTIGTFFTVAVIIFILIQVAYSFHFRNVIILDALLVSSAFVIRVYAGGVAAEISISSWLILATIGLSLLLAFGKRRSEKTLLEDKPAETRKTLRYYPDNLLDSMISMSAAFCIISYSLFTFQVPAQRVDLKIAEALPSILRSPKWMMLTIPIVIYGVARYLFLIYEKKEGESPERVLLSDKPLLAAVVIWGLIVLGIVYLLPIAR